MSINTIGLNAITTLMIIISIIFGIQLSIRQLKNERRTKSVLQAMANGDPSLGLRSNSLLRYEIEQIKMNIQIGRIRAQDDNQFLQELLRHIDSCILVVDGANQVIHKNQALDKLLGPMPADITSPQWRELGQYITSANTSHRDIVVWNKNARNDTLSLHLTYTRLQEKLVKIISIQSIHHALEAKENKAYENLTKVLTHEIANSIMPLSSLAQTAKELLPSQDKFDCEDDLKDLTEALTTITKRSESLGKFIQSFSQITKLPKPQPERLDLTALVKHVLLLLSKSDKSKEIDINFVFDNQSYWVFVDSCQLEQVLVNLIANAKQSLSNVAQKKIQITIKRQSQGGLIVDIEDSGTGIESHVAEHIFIPFFTTKQQGCGIGLSLSRQIMLAHRGDLIYVDKPLDQKQLPGACFRIIFNLT
ncbi:ATP-binding protein [Shewanella sp.]|uniref:sensor histidine kinase n=1 Tax=Shewanella sp. TaxID=50422 RepID=UPI001EBACCE3|nr:ATP-binding protein [Shewanella sp.]NRB25750.1 histidine kinase [Shewanella sp.]